MTRQRVLGVVRDLAARWRVFMGSLYSQAICTQPGIYSVEQFQLALAREKARAERNGHGVSLVIIQTNGRRTRERPRLEDVLRGRLRIMDEAGWFDHSRIGVLMPYTSCQGAWHLIEDMCRLMHGALSASDCRVYTYPQDWCSGRDGDRSREVAGAPERQHAESTVENPRATGGGKDGVGGPGLRWDLTRGESAGTPVWERGLDIAGSLLGLLILSPVFLITAVLIKLVSPGPVLFRQVRIGRGGTPFVLWKFRTMQTDADISIHRNHMARLIRRANGEMAAEPMAKLNNDPRVIRFGQILRGTCIDELPQLVNVLRGEMSLVGPRPPIPYEVREYLPWQRRRFDTAPGLTGLWQVSGKNRLSFEEMIRLDIRYCRTKCLWRAIVILCRTPLAIAQEMGDAWARWRLSKMGVSEHD